jgi:ElaB/YqjD/DUF883 family membrane-anchored ribosome-binding protein
MAEERNLGLARAVSETSDDEDPTKAELQRRMEEARADISQTVTEIKDTVANQYQAVKDSVTEALDWREQYRKRPLAWSVGALSVGFIVGYSLGGTLTGDGSDVEDESPWDIEDYEPVISTKASSAKYQTPEAGRGAAESIPSPAPSYAAQAITGAAHAASSYGAAESASDYSPGRGGEAEPDKPGLLERFKETKAYDRLQEEVSSLGDRFIDELSKVGTTVVLPALFTKIKDLFGVDLSNKQQQSQSGGAGAKPTQTTGGASTGSSPASGSTQTSTGGGSSVGSAYGTSENRPVGASSSERDDYGRRSSSSGGGQL